MIPRSAALVAAAVLIGSAAFLWIRREVPPAPSRTPQASGDVQRRKDLQPLERKVEALSAEVALLREKVAALEAETAALRAAPDPVVTPATQAKGEAPAAAVDLQATLAQIADPSLDQEGRQALWTRLAKAGLLPGAIEALEKRARESSQDADAQVRLAEAYLQKLFTVPEGPEKGIWAMKVNGAYDAALAIDDHHWEARFSKAVGLSFWPPIFGKQPEAVRHLEILLSQQEGVPSQPRFASTYACLANLYAQQGKADKAKDLLGRGLALFPEDLQLQVKAAEMEKLQGSNPR